MYENESVVFNSDRIVQDSMLIRILQTEKRPILEEFSRSLLNIQTRSATIALEYNLRARKNLYMYPFLFLSGRSFTIQAGKHIMTRYSK